MSHAGLRVMGLFGLLSGLTSGMNMRIRRGQLPGYPPPLVGYCVRMRAVRAVTQPESLDREPLPELPPGLRPFESQVFRAMRHATARATEDERAKICRWLRRQAREQPELDARALAELVKGGEHLRSP
jgi:hypothetical protein